MTFTSNKIGPTSTPKIIQLILALTAAINILLSIIPCPSLIFILGLSAEGIRENFFWQFVSSLFIIDTPVLSFGFIIHLLFNLYVIWIFGSSIIELKGNKHYIFVVLLSTLLSSLLAFGIIKLLSFPTLFFGGSILIYCTSMAWLMLHSDAKIFLFFTLPFKAKWLILGAMGLNLLGLLSHGSYLYFLTLLGAGIITYLLSLIIWKTHSPFEFLKKAEQKIIYFLKRKTKHRPFHESKIYDFKTGEPIIDDDEFMDAMLTKISLYGEDFLTKKEKKRMEKISKKKKKNLK
jgi:hypothetical protein